MNTYAQSLLEVKTILGSYNRIGKICGISGIAVGKWIAAGRPPRTEYTGETRYAELISAAVGGKISKEDLLPVLKIKIERRTTDQRTGDRRVGERRASEHDATTTEALDS